MILVIVLSLFVGFLIWLFLTPLVLVVDTTKNQYLITWKGVASARLMGFDGRWKVSVKVFFWKRNFYFPFKKSDKLEKKNKKRKKQKKVNFKRWRHKGWQILKSFEVKRFYLNLDTDDFVKNSQLFPLFYFLSANNRQLKINYEGRAELVLIIENRLWRMLKAFLF